MSTLALIFHKINMRAGKNNGFDKIRPLFYLMSHTDCHPNKVIEIFPSVCNKNTAYGVYMSPPQASSERLSQIPGRFTLPHTRV